jgi:translation elongation factor EF-1beta
MQDGPKYNIRHYPGKYDAFLQNKEFVEWLAKHFDGSMERIAEAVAKFKVEMPDVKIPEMDTAPLEDGLAAINNNIILLIEEQKATNDYLKDLISTMQHVAGVRKPKS